MITTKEIAWAAGFMEGEGSFLLMGKAKKIAVIATQVQKEPLERLEKMFGGHLYQYDYLRKDGYTHQAQWRWYAYARRAAGIMMTLYTLMSPRRKEQIKNCLDVWKTQKRRNLLPYCKNKHPKTEEHGYLYTNPNTGEKKWVCRSCNRESDQARNDRSPHHPTLS